MIKFITITLSVLILLLSISFAADDNEALSKSIKKYEQKDDPCESTGAMGQQECAQIKMDIADKELNAVYKALLAKLPEVEGVEGGETGRYPKKSLIEAQRAWIKYRDANCQFFGEIYGGSPAWQFAENLNCRTKMTITRTEELRNYLDNSN